MAKTFSSYGCRATITKHRDGTATLKVKVYDGTVIHNKVHKNYNAALAAWRRMG